ncbi:solute carrier family 66 member 3 [Leptopilina heterotoma]|uniref:solute carrier family 66 member 3 n=1 Tax=Leptopilina heterotoma TaxID=63436 RepID=UPI001CA7D0DA|nr:solute carrier family 66 member 3 [Leptopilina heterotoma]XP_043465077.1 solute carrier family 66 member 3 [Leptopilina heterotoma]
MEMSLQHFSDLLSIFTIGMCFILKVPQILNLMALKSAKGMSIIGLCLELTSYTVMTSYNITNGYSLLSYLDYPIILVQQYILIFLVLKYLEKINFITILISALYFTTFTSFVLQILPKSLLTLFVPICTPITASSKVVQLLTIHRAKNAESISVLTWFISALTNCTRIFTIWMDSADVLLLGNVTISTFLSSCVMFTVIYYKRHPKTD